MTDLRKMVVFDVAPANHTPTRVPRAVFGRSARAFDMILVFNLCTLQRQILGPACGRHLVVVLVLPAHVRLRTLVFGTLRPKCINSTLLGR